MSIQRLMNQASTYMRRLQLGYNLIQISSGGCAVLCTTVVSMASRETIAQGMQRSSTRRSQSEQTRPGVSFIVDFL